jgi:hypothetical protein
MRWIRSWHDIVTAGLIRLPSQENAITAFAPLCFSRKRNGPVSFLKQYRASPVALALQKACGMPVANGGVMEKLKALHCLAFVLITLFLASCASQTQPATTSGTTQSQSPLERNGGNGLASFIH